MLVLYYITIMFEASSFTLRSTLVISFCCFLSLAGAQITDPSEDVHTDGHVLHELFYSGRVDDTITPGLSKVDKSYCCLGAISALQATRISLIDPWKNLNSWDDGDPCTSKWEGVLCFSMPANDGYLHVKELHLLNTNLSGCLSPELGRLSHMEILDFMWNNISGGIPKEIGNVISLKLLLLNGNQLSGSLPAELGYLPNLNRLQIDENHISGAFPKSFANLKQIMHLHMNNNSISGQIPSEVSKMSTLIHFLLDNNNLSGFLPPEFSDMPRLQILQVDNNNFSGSPIPASYSNMTSLLKMSFRNCSLKGAIPDLSGIRHLTYLDLSSNQLSGSIPANRLSNNITTIVLSNNMLNGSIPSNFSGLPFLQRLALDNNRLSGFVPSNIWINMIFTANSSLILDFQNNFLTDISGVLRPPPNVTIMLHGNPICANANQSNIVQFCGSYSKLVPESSRIYANVCLPQLCPKEDFFEYNPASPVPCFCAAPLRIGYRLKSPGFSDFHPYHDAFMGCLTSDLNIFHYQLYIDTFSWEEGPRLRMYLKIFPSGSPEFDTSEIRRIFDMFAGWNIHNRDIYGPYELLHFTLLGPYSKVNLESTSGLSKGTLVGIVLGAGFGAAAITVLISVFIMRRHSRYHHLVSRRRSLSMSIKIDDVRGFTYAEMARVTNNFSNSTQVGQGGYGKVYKGILADGTAVAIKRAHEGSLQGSKEFFTEIEFMSRLHHRNLLSLVGYCNEEAEQMLVYEFMPNGTLRDHLSLRSKEPLSFSLRLRIALGSARGILYLHTEADPPIFHRDIKASNILLDSRFVAKVADFGLSRLAPVANAEGTIHGHISTVVKGTPGYLDPEYFLTHKMTDKSDVYSLGVVFLELLTGMRPIQHGKNIVREVNIVHNSGTIFSIIDGYMGSYPAECIEKFVSLALRCCHEKTDLRPTIQEVVWELESLWKMTSDAEAMPSESMNADSSNKPSKSPSMSSMDVSVSGADHQASVMSAISPR